MDTAVAKTTHRNFELDASKKSEGHIAQQKIMKSVVSALVIFGAARATSDFGGDPHGVGSPYYYSEINSSEYDAESDYQSQNDNDESAEMSSRIVSSLTFDGGCFVSAQAIMCNGGGDPLFYMDTALDSDEAYSDDDDDEDDDGHSSMLSNASLKRSKALVGGPAASATKSQNSNGQLHFASHAPQYGGTTRLRRNPAATFAALQVRGGSISSIANNELARKLVVAAIVTLVFEGCVGHVLEFFKIVMQTSPSGTTYTQVYREITSEKGIGGLW